MPLFPSKWRLVVSHETEMKQQLEEVGILLHRMVMEPSGRDFFKVELFYEEELVFLLDSNPKAEAKVFMVRVNNKDPLTALMEDANRERV